MCKSKKYMPIIASGSYVEHTAECEYAKEDGSGTIFCGCGMKVVNATEIG